MRLRFGKYKGQMIANVPASYLHWLVRNAWNLTYAEKATLEAYLGVGQYSPDSATAERAGKVGDDLLADVKDAVSRCRRALAGKFHPDRGGSTEAMQWINDAMDTLTTELEDLR